MSLFKRSTYIFLSKASFLVSYFLMSVMVARMIGLVDFGVYLLVLNLYLLFEKLSTAWLEDIIIREVSQDHSKARLYFSHGLIIGLFSSGICFFSFIILGCAMQYDPPIQAAIRHLGILLFLAFLYFNLETIIIAVQKPKYAFKSALFRDITMLLIGYFVLRSGHGIIQVINAMIIARLIGFLSLLYYSRRQGIGLYSPVDRSFLKKIWHSVPVFLGISVSSNIYLDADIIILSRILPISELGIYSLAKRIVRAGHIFHYGVITPFVPSIGKALRLLKEERVRHYRHLALVVFGLSLLFILLMLLLSGPIIYLFYGKQYMPALKYLKILAWSLIPLSLNFLLTRYLIIGHQQNTVLLNLMGGALCLIPMGIIFSVHWAGTGMAAAYILAAFIMVGLSNCTALRLVERGV